jgi:hypothetical protein
MGNSKGDMKTTGSSNKSMGVAGSLNVVHPFIIFQICLYQGDPFFIEISLRDKNNVSSTSYFWS